MTRITAALLFAALLAGSASARYGKPEDIPEARRIRIDGNLTDWRRADWTPLEQKLDGDPANISNARWSVAWDDDAALFIAVQYDDADILLENGSVHSNGQDCVEIYVRGDIESVPSEYAVQQNSAQQYTFGLSKDKLTTWKQLGSFTNFPAHNPAKASVRLDGNTFIYEIMVPLYDEFDATSRRKCSETEVDLEGEDDEEGETLEIGVDIAIIDAGKSGYAGMKSENTMSGKRTDADQIAEHQLDD